MAMTITIHATLERMQNKHTAKAQWEIYTTRAGCRNTSPQMNENGRQQEAHDKRENEKKMK